MPQAPEWLESLVDAVVGGVQAHNPMGPIGFLYGEEEGAWEVVIYPTPVELVGGAIDGEVVSPGFSLDLEILRALFDRVDALQWTAHSLGPDDPERPHISIEGIYRGHEIWLRVLTYAPDDEEPGIKLNVK